MSPCSTYSSRMGAISPVNFAARELHHDPVDRTELVNVDAHAAPTFLGGFPADGSAVVGRVLVLAGLCRDPAPGTSSRVGETGRSRRTTSPRAVSGRGF